MMVATETVRGSHLLWSVALLGLSGSQHQALRDQPSSGMEATLYSAEGTLPQYTLLQLEHQ